MHGLLARLAALFRRRPRASSAAPLPSDHDDGCILMFDDHGHKFVPLNAYIAKCREVEQLERELAACKGAR